MREAISATYCDDLSVPHVNIAVAKITKRVIHGEEDGVADSELVASRNARSLCDGARGGRENPWGT